MKSLALLVLSLILTNCAAAQSYRNSIPRDLTGRWYTGNASSLALLNRAAEISDASNGGGSSLEIKADGTFVKAGAMKAGTYECPIVIFTYETGSFQSVKSNLTLSDKEKIVSYKNGCNSEANSEKKAETVEYKFQYEVTTDEDGKVMLCLDNGDKAMCFRKEEKG